MRRKGKLRGGKHYGTSESWGTLQTPALRGGRGYGIIFENAVRQTVRGVCAPRSGPSLSGARYAVKGVRTTVNIKKLENELWESADLLRAGSKLTSNQYCMPVMGLIFLRYAFSRFKRTEQEILKSSRPERGGRVMPVEASDFASKSAIFLPREAQYEYLVNLPSNVASSGLVNRAGHAMNSLGEAVNNAMELVEAQSEQLAGVLPKEYTIFTDELLADLLRIFNNSALDDVKGDVIGRIYEYFLNKFAKNIAQDDGVFFTPKPLVKMIVNVLEPTSGILLDPACGSGGMFVQTGDFVSAAGREANSAMTLYGQEKVEYNAKLCLMNMAVHGLNGLIKSGDEANTFYHDAHGLKGKCDYVMANPPFNVDKVNADAAISEGRLPFGTPAINKAREINNANYLWISYFYAYLNDHGRAGFVMSSSTTDSARRDREIRAALVETGHVDVMISVGSNFFYAKSLPCSLWFFDKGKRPELRNTVLFLDARNYYTVVDRTLNEWSEWQLKNLTAIVWLYRGEQEKYRALLREYELALGTPAFARRMDQLALEMADLRSEAKEAVEKAARREKKKVRAEYDRRMAELEEAFVTAREAVWLCEKFGEGEYRDVLGLCRAAGLEEIREKNYSLTPGAYVGVAPVEDDGVDFAQRMGEIYRELLTLQAESNELMERISQNMKEIGL
ncbi:MAG: SAM-dependent DNA methyltransferase [Lawsonibacter sp.]|nr:SAM-dependent DNA methyltransferase [Lawsonibacter sp.]